MEEVRVGPRIEVSQGDIVTASGDVVVVPTTTNLSSGDPWTRLLRESKVSVPARKIEVGDVLLLDVPDPWSFALIALVATLNRSRGGSSVDDVQLAAANLGSALTASTAAGSVVVAPLLGSGAGGLGPAESLRAMTTGFTRTASPEKVLRVLVRDAAEWRALQPVLTDIVGPAPTPESVSLTPESVSLTPESVSLTPESVSPHPRTVSSPHDGSPRSDGGDETAPQPVPSPTVDLARWSHAALLALGSAQAWSRAEGRSRIHLEHLVLGMAMDPRGPLAPLLGSRGIDLRALSVALLDKPARTETLELESLRGAPPTVPPVLSGHARRAIVQAEALAKDSPTVAISHLFRGAFLVPECSAIRSLEQLGVRAEDVTNVLPDRERVRLTVDEPVGMEDDVLHRRAVAEALHSQLDNLAQEYADQGKSYLVHVDGAWGSGKSTLLRFLKESIATASEQTPPPDAHRWLVVDYDAWRQSKGGACWLTLLQALRTEVAARQRQRTRNPFPWMLFLARERLRLVGNWQWAAAFVMTLAAGLLVWLVVVLGSKPSVTTMNETVKLLGGIASLGGALWLVATSFGRLVTLDSRRSARTFLDSRADPMEDLARHFDWVLRQAGGPVVLLIDDLDRCPDSFVVELLDSVQKLMRDTQALRSSAKGSRPALIVIVAADGRWIRQSFDNAYAALADAIREPGASVGSLFLEKLFQMSVPVPHMSDTLRAQFLTSVLAEGSGSRAEAVSEGELSQQLQDAPQEEVLSMLAEHSPLERMRVAPTAVRRLVIDDNAQAATRHALEEYALLLDPTPRAMKRFVMQYSMFRAVRTAEGSVIPTGPLALWTVLHTRWPLLAELLQATPEAVQFFEGPATRIPPSVPEDLRRVFTDPPAALREVMNHVAGPLDEATIREASGQA